MSSSKTILASMAALLSALVVAAPASSTTTAAPSPSSTNIADYKQFALRISAGPPAIPGAHANWDGKYIAGYHLEPTKRYIVAADASQKEAGLYLNGTALMWNTLQYGYPTVTNLRGDWSWYSAWGAPYAEIGLPSDQFDDGPFIIDAKRGLIVNGTSNSFQNWIICDWVHEYPQLFWTIPYGVDPVTKIPSSCQVVKLVPEYTK